MKNPKKILLEDWFKLPKTQQDWLIEFSAVKSKLLKIRDFAPYRFTINLRDCLALETAFNQKDGEEYCHNIERILGIQADSLDEWPLGNTFKLITCNCESKVLAFALTLGIIEVEE